MTETATKALTEALRLAGQPGAEAWNLITSLASALPDQDIRRLDSELIGWPDELRLAPRDWGVRVWPEDTSPYLPRALRLARRLMIRREPLLDEDIAALLATGDLRNLRELWLDDNGLTHAALRMLATTDGLPNLRWLGVFSGNVDDPGLAVLAEGRWPALETLSLSSNGLTDAAFARLRPGVLPTIRTLILADNAVGDDAVTSLARVGLLHHIQDLQFAGCDVGDAGLRIIVSATQALVLLGLQACPVHDAGLAALARSNHRPEYLDLSETRVSVDGVRELVDSPASDRLTHLDLSWRPLGRPGAEVLANAVHLGSLGTLRVVGTELGGDEIATLLRGPGLPSLRRLDARWNLIDDAGLAELMALPERIRLERLYLAHNRVERTHHELEAGGPIDLMSEGEYQGPA